MTSTTLTVAHQRDPTMTSRLSPKMVTTTAATTPGTKSRRVRTGCLTCRERHLKCDESLPDCMNCRKGSRSCKRGIRLNFLDTHTQVHAPSHTPRSHSWAGQSFALSFLSSRLGVPRSMCLIKQQSSFKTSLVILPRSIVAAWRDTPRPESPRADVRPPP